MDAEQELDKLRIIVLVLIGLRLALSLVVFVGKIFVTKQSSLSLILLYGLSPSGLLLLLPQLIPLVWLMPAFFLYQGNKAGFTLARTFAVLLIVLNITGLFMIVLSPVSGVLSLMLVLIAAAIFYFSNKAIRYFPKEETKGVPAIINEANAQFVKMVFFVAAGLVTASPGLFVVWQNVALQGKFSMIQLTISLAVFLAGGFVGSVVASSLRKNLEEGRESIAKFAIFSGANAGVVCGALAQFGLWGSLLLSAGNSDLGGLSFNIFILAIAVVVGAGLGLVAGVAGSLVACTVAKRFMVEG